MIPRYSLPELDEIWSDKTRFTTWLEVELCACEAMEENGLVPIGVSDKIRAMHIENQLDPARIREIELTTRHDVIAFLTHVEELAGRDARWLHRGMTSSDLVDTALAISLRRSSVAITTRLSNLINILCSKADRYIDTPMIGRSHGMHAEPTTFGIVMAGHAAEFQRCKARITAAQEEIAVGKLSGAVGTYAFVSPVPEKVAMQKLVLRPEKVSTQIIPRDRHAMFFATLAVTAAAVERLATNIRHLQRTEIGEVSEPFGNAQKGSSAMPHKANPIKCENLCGLARIVRSSVIPALENVALWHERDISHSSVERVIAPDATGVLAFMLENMAAIIKNLVVYPERMRANIDQTGGLIFSEAVLLALVDRGMPRQKAHTVVQRSALKAARGEGTFRGNLAADEEVTETMVDPGVLDECFSLDKMLQYAHIIVDRLHLIFEN